jgi:hypothetical protein
MKIISNVNPNRQPISWDKFMLLCKATGLELSASDPQGRFKLYKNKIEIAHQIRKSKEGTLRASGWFSLTFGRGSQWRGHPLTAGGQVAIVESISPLLSMDLASQQAFVSVVEYVFLARTAK